MKILGCEHENTGLRALQPWIFTEHRALVLRGYSSTGGLGSGLEGVWVRRSKIVTLSVETVQNGRAAVGTHVRASELTNHNHANE